MVKKNIFVRYYWLYSIMAFDFCHSQVYVSFCVLCCDFFGFGNTRHQQTGAADAVHQADDGRGRDPGQRVQVRHAQAQQLSEQGNFVDVFVCAHRPCSVSISMFRRCRRWAPWDCMRRKNNKRSKVSYVCVFAYVWIRSSTNKHRHNSRKLSISTPVNHPSRQS